MNRLSRLFHRIPKSTSSALNSPVRTKTTSTMSAQYAKQQREGFTNRIENVAVIGAGGHVGSHIVEELLKTGQHKVTALTRPESTSKLPNGLARKDVDYSSHSGLVEALRGQEALVITLSTQAPKDQEGKIIKAASEANVRWIFPNHWGGDVTAPTLAKEMLHGASMEQAAKDVEAAGKSSWIGVVSSFWYEWSLAGGIPSFGIDLQKHKAAFYDDGTTRINVSTWPQCGRAIARLLSLKELPDDENDKAVALANWRNNYCYISSFTVSQRDMLASAQRATGTTDKDWEITERPLPAYYHESMERLKGGDRMGFIGAMYSRVFFKNGGGDYTHKLDNDKLGLPKEDLDEQTKKTLQWMKDGTVRIISV